MDEFSDDIYISCSQDKSEGTLEKSKSEEKESSISTKDFTIQEFMIIKREKGMLNNKRARSDGLSDDDDECGDQEEDSEIEKIKQKKQINESKQINRLFSEIKRSIEVIYKTINNLLIIIDIILFLLNFHFLNRASYRVI
jgi:hypothetical protein